VAARATAALALAALACAGAAATSRVSPPLAREAGVYRCGNLYSQAPCPGATTPDVRDPRTEDERRQAHDVAAREQRLAAKLEAQRHAREAPASAPAPARKKAKPTCLAASEPAPDDDAACPTRRSRHKSKPKSGATSEPVFVTPRTATGPTTQ
jgi:hypothetical protein